MGCFRNISKPWWSSLSLLLIEWSSSSFLSLPFPSVPASRTFLGDNPFANYFDLYFLNLRLRLYWSYRTELQMGERHHQSDIGNVKINKMQALLQGTHSLTNVKMNFFFFAWSITAMCNCQIWVLAPGLGQPSCRSLLSYHYHDPTQTPLSQTQSSGGNSS